MNNNEIWKNVKWNNIDEKRKFFNKYFNGKNRSFVNEQIELNFKLKKEDIINYIDTSIIRKNKPDRKPNIDEIKQYIIEL